MGQNNNIGQQTALAVYGNPESFNKLISNHGVLCKIKQALVCPCVGLNYGSPKFDCTICNGDGRTYTYQRRFLVVDENSRTCQNVITPFWTPVIDVTKVQNVTSEIQGGIRNISVSGTDGEKIYLNENLLEYEKKRVTYTFDGWTYVEEEELEVDATNGLMYANGTEFNAGYQSSNPLKAFADIARVVKIWNKNTGIEITDYTYEGKTIITSQPIESGAMMIEYYYADLTQVIPTDIATQLNNETWTEAITSGQTKMAFYPYWNLTRGDIIVIAASVLYKNESFTHQGSLDKLWEMEVFELNDIILDEDGNTYNKDTDYILQGNRHIKWIGTKPANGKVCSVRYGYKPTFIVFEDQPEPLNHENKLYPKMCLVKNWSKISKDDIARLG